MAVLGWSIVISLILFTIWLNWEMGYIQMVYTQINDQPILKRILVLVGILVIALIFITSCIIYEETTRQWISAAGIPVVTLIVGIFFTTRQTNRDFRLRQESQNRQELLRNYISDIQQLLIDKNLQELPNNSLISQAASALTVVALRGVGSKEINNDEVDQEVEEAQNTIFRFLASVRLLQGEKPALLKGVDLEEIKKLKRAFLLEANLEGAVLKNVDFTEAELTNAILNRANLQQVHLKNAFLVNAQLKNADLTECTAVKAQFSQADLTNAKLINANLSGANLENAQLFMAKLRGADLCGANLTGATISQTDFTNAKYNSKTTEFPESFEPKNYDMIQVDE
jgi:uncharacterized protein YjbI with pentapeptide repeats